MVKCPNCPHPLKGLHNKLTGRCKLCRCEGPHGAVKGGYASDLAKSAPSLRHTKDEVQRAARAPVVRRGVESPPHKVGDIGSELSREFKRLSKGGKP